MQYEMIKEFKKNDYGVPVAVYGIVCGNVRFPDISCSPDAVTALADKFNKYGLLPEHFRDAVEDFLNT